MGTAVLSVQSEGSYLFSRLLKVKIFRIYIKRNPNFVYDTSSYTELFQNGLQFDLNSIVRFIFEVQIYCGHHNIIPQLIHSSAKSTLHTFQKSFTFTQCSKLLWYALWKYKI